MNPGAFAFYTCLGGNEALIQQYQHHITVGVIAFVALVIGGYWWWNKRH